MFYLLFAFYFVAFCFWFAKANFFANSGIGFKNLTALFTIKVLAGILYGVYFSQPPQIESADTWHYFIESKVETDWLLTNPKAFFADLFTNHYSNSNGFFSSTHSIWNDLKETFFVKLLAILNLFTNKNYYINILFFNAVCMAGCVALFKVFYQSFFIQKWILIVAVFLAPAFLFYCSGVHKDGLVFSTTAISIFSFGKILSGSKKMKQLVVLVVCFAVIFLLRNYYLLAMLPAFFSWFLVEKYKINSKIIFPSVTVFCLAFFIFSNSFNATNSLSKSLVEKHNNFATLAGNTKFQTPKLNETATSLVAYLPFALQASLFRPLPNHIVSKGELLLSIENYAFIILLFVAIVISFRKKPQVFASPIIFACFTLSFFLLLFIGYTVCFDGAIIRYRSVLFPFLLTPVLIIIFGKDKNKFVGKEI